MIAATNVVRYETSKRINYNRLVEDQYSAEESGKVKLVHIGTVAGKRAWANGFMLEISEVPPHLKSLKKYRERALDVYGKPRDFTSLVPDASPDDTIVRPLARTTELKDDWPAKPSITYLASDGKEFTAQTKYIDYFLIRYPDAQFIMQKANSPMRVASKGKPVGVIMPIKTEDEVILQFRDFLRAERPVVKAKTRREQIWDFDYNHTLEDLKKMAREKGVSPSGTKHEIIGRLI